MTRRARHGGEHTAASEVSEPPHAELRWHVLAAATAGALVVPSRSLSVFAVALLHIHAAVSGFARGIRRARREDGVTRATGLVGAVVVDFFGAITTVGLVGIVRRAKPMGWAPDVRVMFAAAVALLVVASARWITSRTRVPVGYSVPALALITVALVLWFVGSPSLDPTAAMVLSAFAFRRFVVGEA